MVMVIVRRLLGEKHRLGAGKLQGKLTEIEDGPIRIRFVRIADLCTLSFGSVTES
jgi:hypothetical protein